MIRFYLNHTPQQYVSCQYQPRHGCSTIGTKSVMTKTSKKGGNKCDSE